MHWCTRSPFLFCRCTDRLTAALRKQPRAYSLLPDCRWFVARWCGCLLSFPALSLSSALYIASLCCCFCWGPLRSVEPNLFPVRPVAAATTSALNLPHRPLLPPSIPTRTRADCTFCPFIIILARFFFSPLPLGAFNTRT